MFCRGQRQYRFLDRGVERAVLVAQLQDQAAHQGYQQEQWKQSKAIMQFSNSESSDFLPFRRQEVHRLQPVVSDGVTATKHGLVALAGVEQGGPNRLQLRHSLLVMDNEPWRLGCQTFSLLQETSATTYSKQGQQWTLGVVNRSKAWHLGHSCTALIQCQRQWHFPVPVAVFQCQCHFSSASCTSPVPALFQCSASCTSPVPAALFPVPVALFQCQRHFSSASCTCPALFPVPLALFQCQRHFSSASCTCPVPALFQRSASCTCPVPAALFPVPVHFPSASCTFPAPVPLFQCQLVPVALPQCQLHLPSASCTFSSASALPQCQLHFSSATFPVPVALAQCHTVFHALKKVLPRNIPKDFQNVSNNFTCTIAYSYEHVRRSFSSVNKPG